MTDTQTNVRSEPPRRTACAGRGGRWPSHTFGAALIPLVLLSAASCGDRAGVAGRPSLTASPNPVWPRLLAGSGTTVIRWNTGDGRNGRVLVSVDGAPATLFASGPSGESAAPWIATGPVYAFRLETVDPPTTVASVVVTRHEDAVAASVLAAVGLLTGVLLLLLAPSGRRRSWLLEAGFLALVLVPLWIKFVHMSSVLRPHTAAVPDRVVLSATLAALCALWVPLIVVERRWRAPAALGAALILTTIGVADLAHARFFDRVMAASELTAAGQLGRFTSSLGPLLRRSDAWYYADCMAGAVLLAAYMRLSRRLPPLVRHEKTILAGALLGLGLVSTIPLVVLSSHGYSWTRWLPQETVGKIGVLPFHMYDVLDTLVVSIRRPAVGGAEIREIGARLAEWRSAGQIHSPFHGVARGKNVILVNSESIQAYLPGLRVGGSPVVPHLEALMRESVWFPDFYDQTDLGRSSDAELLVLESLYPLADGAAAMRYPSRTPYGLPAILKARGYHTTSATGTAADIWNMGRRHPLQPFDRSYFEASFPGAEHFNGAVADHLFFEAMAGRIARQPEPFLTFLMSASTHMPYDVPAGHRRLPLGELEGTLLGRYLVAAHYFDAALGDFIEGLRSSGMLDRTVLVVYGDHRTYVDEPALARLLSLAPDDPLAMWKATYRVPLAIRLPGGAPAGPRTITGGHVDIAPTLLDLLGIDEPDAAMLGRNLLAGSDGLVVFRDESATNGRHLRFSVGFDAGAPDCFELSPQHEVECAGVAGLSREARARLRISDLIVHGDLIPCLVPAAPRTEACP